MTSPGARPAASAGLPAVSAPTFTPGPATMGQQGRAIILFIGDGMGEGFRRPSRERCEAMTLHLYRHGILAKLRQSAGQDIDGGCGQLRARRLAAA